MATLLRAPQFDALPPPASSPGALDVEALRVRYVSVCAAVGPANEGLRECIAAHNEYVVAKHRFEEAQLTFGLGVLPAFATTRPVGVGPTLIEEGPQSASRVLPSVSRGQGAPSGPRPGGSPTGALGAKKPRPPRPPRPSRRPRPPRKPRPPRPPRNARPPAFKIPKGPKLGPIDDGTAKYCVLQDPEGQFACHPPTCHRLPRTLAAKLQAMHPGADFIETDNCADCGGGGCGVSAPLELHQLCSKIVPRTPNTQRRLIIERAIARRRTRPNLNRVTLRVVTVPCVRTESISATSSPTVPPGECGPNGRQVVVPVKKRPPVSGEGVWLWGPAPGRTIYPPGPRGFPAGWDPNVQLPGHQGAWVLVSRGELAGSTNIEKPAAPGAPPTSPTS